MKQLNKLELPVKSISSFKYTKLYQGNHTHVWNTLKIILTLSVCVLFCVYE